MKKNKDAFPSLEWVDNKGNYLSDVIEDQISIGRSYSETPIKKRIQIQDVKVSREHATVTFTGSQLLIRDCSTNGTRVNGVRLKLGTEQELRNNDIIKIGNVEFKVAISQFNNRTHVSMGDKTQIASGIIYVTNLVADARGYSSLSQQLSPTVISKYMGQIFSSLSKIVHIHQGTIMDFAGDALFAYWEHGEEINNEIAQKACKAALQQKAAVPKQCQTIPEKYLPLRNLRFGWGITTGKVSVSYYGFKNDNLALVGDCTNLAFRLSSIANKDIPCPIIMCKQTAEVLGEAFPLKYFGTVETKGRVGEEHIYGLP